MSSAAGMGEFGLVAAAFVRLGVATLHEGARRRGLCRGLRLLSGPPFAGPAVTVDLPAGDNLGVHAALARASTGQVLCAASAGDGRYGVIGELILTAARARGLAGLVIDDGIRDLDELAAPPSVAARGVSAQGTVKRRYRSLQQAVAIGGVLVRPGDWVVVDHDGVCVIPAASVGPVIESGERRSEREDRMREALEAGRTTVDVLELADLIDRSEP